MTRNAIQMMMRILELTDYVKAGRQEDSTIMNCINDAIIMIVKNRIDPIKDDKKKYSVQSSQRVRDELYTLIPNAATGAVSSGLVAYPTNPSYFSYLSLKVYVDSVQQVCYPTSYGEEGLLNDDPFAETASDQVYFNEKHDGLRIISASGSTLGNYELWYIKTPNAVTIGNADDKKTDGATLTNAVTYYAYDESVYSGVTYYPGEAITGTGAALTSGTVIPASVITDCNLPPNLHSEVCFLAAKILSGEVDEYNKAAFLNNNVEKS